MPFAGVSAGALLALEKCVLSAEETSDNSLQMVAGLNLARDIVIGVHFTATHALPEMLEAMAQTRTRNGLGIDDEACAVFDDGRFIGVLGQQVYEVEMDDFEKRTYCVAECRVKYPSLDAA